MAQPVPAELPRRAARDALMQLLRGLLRVSTAVAKAPPLHC